MKTIIALMTVAFVLAIGGVTVLTVHPQPALACSSANCN